MRTITLKLPDGLAARVSATVRRRGVSTSALVREALEDRLGGETRDRTGSCLDLAADLAGALTGPADLASNARHLKGYGR
ncbi:MAG: ribbon-helix-helix protein, CopG family [Chloroflexi bacterium]|nr:MAG: ribbon-helix-helix protein, CopG family [Chloroflexota bacterium]